MEELIIENPEQSKAKETKEEIVKTEGESTSGSINRSNRNSSNNSKDSSSSSNKKVN